MRRRRLALVIACLSVAGLTGGVAAAPSAVAKSAKCYATPVPDQPGTYIVTCTTNRP